MLSIEFDALQTELAEAQTQIRNASIPPVDSKQLEELRELGSDEHQTGWLKLGGGILFVVGYALIRAAPAILALSLIVFGLGWLLR